LVKPKHVGAFIVNLNVNFNILKQTDCALVGLIKDLISAQLFHKGSHCYMFRHYRVVFRQLVINTLPSYTSISNAAVGNTIYN